MSCKFAILLLVAFVGYQSASATLQLNGSPFVENKHHHHRHLSLFEPLDHPVTFVGKILNLRPLRFVRRVLLFPVFVVLKAIRVVLTPVRVILLPLHFVLRIVHTIFRPVRLTIRFVMNVLLSLPIIRIATRAFLGVFRVLTFPVRAITGVLRFVLGQ